MPSMANDGIAIHPIADHGKEYGFCRISPMPRVCRGMPKDTERCRGMPQMPTQTRTKTQTKLKRNLKP